MAQFDREGSLRFQVSQGPLYLVLPLGSSAKADNEANNFSFESLPSRIEPLPRFCRAAIA